MRRIPDIGDRPRLMGTRPTQRDFDWRKSMKVIEFGFSITTRSAKRSAVEGGVARCCAIWPVHLDVAKKRVVPADVLVFSSAPGVVESS